MSELTIPPRTPPAANRSSYELVRPTPFSLGLAAITCLAVSAALYLETPRKATFLTKSNVVVIGSVTLANYGGAKWIEFYEAQKRELQPSWIARDFQALQEKMKVNDEKAGTIEGARELLGVSEEATREEIEAAHYRIVEDLSKRLNHVNHPKIPRMGGHSPGGRFSGVLQTLIDTANRAKETLLKNE